MSKIVITAFLALFLGPGSILTTLPASGYMASEGVFLADSGIFSVDEDDFDSRCLVWSYFRALAENPDVMIIDVRTGFLPANDPPGLKNVRPIPLEIFVPNFAARKVHQDKTLLIFDESGLELGRLQYHLRKYGYDDYFFLEGGAAGAMNPHRGGS